MEIFETSLYSMLMEVEITFKAEIVRKTQEILEIKALFPRRLTMRTSVPRGRLRRRNTAYMLSSKSDD